MPNTLIGMARIRSHPGLISAIARSLGITRAAVAKWRLIPAERVIPIEGITGIDRHYLRPDLYPLPLSGEQRLAKPNGRSKRNPLTANL